MSERKITDRDYLNLSAMLSAREARMPGRELLERMLTAPGFSEAAKLLTDCGYEDFSALDGAGVDAALSARRAAVFAELARMTPQREVVDVFRLRYDYHNIKVLVKAEGTRVDAERLLSGAGRVDAERLAAAFREEDWRPLPPDMASAIREAKAVLGRTANPQTADFVLDRLYFAELSRLAAASGSAFLTGYAALLTDSANLRSAVRCARMGKNREFLLTALSSGGSVSPERLAAAVSGGEGPGAVFSSGALQKAAALGNEAAKGGSMTQFELACDNAVSSYLSAARRKPFGVEPVAEYLAAVESEITAVRMVLQGKRAGIAPEMIRERLRDLYA